MCFVSPIESGLHVIMYHVSLLWIEWMWYQVVELTTGIGTRVAGVLVSKLDSESKTLNLRLRGGMCEVISGV